MFAPYTNILNVAFPSRIFGVFKCSYLCGVYHWSISTYISTYTSAWTWTLKSWTFSTFENTNRNDRMSYKLLHRYMSSHDMYTYVYNIYDRTWLSTTDSYARTYVRTVSKIVNTICCFFVHTAELYEPTHCVDIGRSVWTGRLGAPVFCNVDCMCLCTGCKPWCRWIVRSIGFVPPRGEKRHKIRLPPLSFFFFCPDRARYVWIIL